MLLPVKPMVSHKDTKAFLTAMAFQESSGNQKAINKWGMLGLYQFSPATLKAMRVKVSKNKFLSDATLQDSVMLAYMRDNWTNLRKYHKFVGKKHKGVKITKSGLLAMTHLVGLTGVCAEFYPKKCKHITKDANGTKAVDYLRKFANFEIELPR